METKTPKRGWRLQSGSRYLNDFSEKSSVYCSVLAFGLYRYTVRRVV